MPHQRGLGLAGIPEIDTDLAAQNALVARAQGGSLVPRQDRPTATTPQELGKRAGEPATVKPTERKPGTIDFEKDALGSIGVILREAGAALQNKPSPSVGVRETAETEERLRAGLELQAQGLRLKGASQAMASLLKAVELGRTIPPNELEKFFAGFGDIFNIKSIGGGGGFDVAGLAKEILEGKRPGLEDQIKELQNDPITAAYVANLIGDSPSIDRMEKAIEGALKLKAELVGDVLKQKILAPGKAAQEIETARQKTLATERAKQTVRAEGPRELEGARTVEPNQDIPLPSGGVIPKGTAITVRPVKDKPVSVTTVFGSEGKSIEVEIPDAVIPGLTRERKLEAPTATQRGQIELRIRFLDDALSQLQILKRVVEETPTGAAGEIVKALQGTYDQALTLAETIPGVDALVNITERGIAFIDSSLFKADTPEERDELDNIRRSFLNTNLPAIPIMQEGIAIALAAASFPTTQRIPVEAIKEARKNVDLTGLFGPGRGTALAKLNTIIARIESNKTFLGQRKTAIEKPAIKGKPVSREEQKRRLLEKFGIKPR